MAGGRTDARHPDGSGAALWALGAVFTITVAWWALALWPVAGGDPDWLERARVACFNAGPNGLPDPSGWMLLVGQPLGMLGFLVLVWPEAVRAGLARAAGHRAGMAALGAAALVLVGGVAGAAVRVAGARQPPPALPTAAMATPAEDHARLGIQAAELDLVDQSGALVTIASLAGRPALVTFAFGNCADICPLVVAHARATRDAVWGPDGGSLVVVTLDPWRDTPARLPSLAERWLLDGPRDHVVGGTVREVESVLDAWAVSRTRDGRTGDIAHPPLTYLVDADGAIAFATLGGRKVLEGLARRLAGGGAPRPESDGADRRPR